MDTSNDSSRAELACRLERLKRIHQDQQQRNELEVGSTPFHPLPDLQAQSLYRTVNRESVPFGFEKGEYAAIRESRFGLGALINEPEL